MMWKRWTVRVGMVSLFVGLLPGTATAKPGDPEVGFGAPNGHVTLEFGTANVGVQDVLVEPDTGKIVAAVAIQDTILSDEFGIARFLPSGALDPTFNPLGATPGVQRTGTSQITPESPFAITRASDGSYVAAGIGNGGDFVIVRVTSAGALDTELDGSGWTFVDVPGGTVETVAGVEVAADGAITVAATTVFPADSTPSNRAIVVARVLADGTPDESFDESPTVEPKGMVFVEGNGETESGFGMLVDPGGRTVVAGSTAVTGQPGKVFVTRLTASGARDAAFSADGIQELSLGTPAAPDQASDVIRQPNGRLVVLAAVDPLFTPASFAIAGLTDAGELDPGFGTNGVTITPVGGVAELGLPTRMAFEPGGRLVVVGNRVVAPTSFFAVLVRYEADGKLDTSYGTQGVSQPAVTAGPDPLVQSVAVDPQGRAVIAGLVQTTPSKGLIARFEGGPPPANAIPPSITGVRAVGQKLTCAPGTWTGTPPQAYTYAWLRAGSAVAGATSPSYTTVAADGDRTLVCRVTALSFAGSGVAQSAAVTILTPPKVKLSGKRKQDVDTLAVRVRSNEKVTVKGNAVVKRPGGGKAIQATLPRAKIAAGARITVAVKFGSRLGELKRLLGQGEKLTVTITVRAKDATGAKTVVRRTVRLRS